MTLPGLQAGPRSSPREEPGPGEGVERYITLAGLAARVLAELPPSAPEANRLAAAVEQSGEALLGELHGETDRFNTRIALQKLEEAIRRGALLPPFVRRMPGRAGTEEALDRAA
ncbi:MAG TPA: hypothetical protein VFU47_10855 [Armatimonadota bacterium]|nr:hypothetical protein [Armatimonadota bacterium]